MSGSAAVRALGRVARTAPPLLTALLWLIPIGRDEAQRRAAEELAKAKYGGLPPAAEQALDRLGRLTERLVDLITTILVGRTGGAGLGIGAWMVVIVILIVLALIVWRFGLPRWIRRRRSAVVELEPARAAADYRSLSAEAAAAGDWHAAVRDRFRAVVRELEVRTILDVRPARTAWEAATGAARSLPQCREALLAAAELFNTVVYGDRGAGPSAYATMVALDEEVVAAADDVDLTDDPVAAFTPAGLR